MAIVYTRSLVLLAAGLGAVAQPAAACSTTPFPNVRVKQASYFIATAASDTLHAGPGSLTYYPSDPRISEPLSEPPHPIYGQVVRVERFAGPIEAEVQAVLKRHNNRAVLVPWGSRGDCRRSPWEGSARWMAPGTRGTFVAYLRPQSEWIDGKPTLDIGSPWRQPYTVERAREDAEDPKAPILTPSEYLSLLLALPVWDSETRSKVSEGNWREWVQKHPKLATRFPATEILRWVRGEYP